MDACMHSEQFKVQLFRFIDVLPCLTTEENLGRHIQEYFAGGEGTPAVLKWGVKGVGMTGRLGLAVLGRALRANLEMMARSFIVGATVPETIDRLRALRKQGYAFTLDVLGEATLSEREADQYVTGYTALLDGLEAAQRQWPGLGAGAEAGLDWGHAPRVNVSVKPSALFSQADPANFEGSVEGILARLRPLYRKVMALGGFLCVDIEARRLKNITFEVFRRLRSAPEFAAYPHLGLAVQVYLREADADVDQLLDWARRLGLPISVRLVKGAYWDYEIILADQNGWSPPVYTVKANTDASFERNAEKILRNQDICHLACASHNVWSVCAVMEMARALKVPEDRYEFQALYGMAEPFREALLKMTGRVRLYCPHGDMLPGMAYLIRRLLENTANESFLRQTFAEGVAMDRLLSAPQERPEAPPPPLPAAPSGLSPFANEPFPDWTQPACRRAYAQAIAQVRMNLGRTYPLRIGGTEVRTQQVVESVNPASPGEVIGRVCQAGTREVEDAIRAAQAAFPAWRDTPARDRAAYLIRAAQIARRRIFELAAWQTLEAGKQWTQAYLDVGEAIDFLEYYAREMVRLGEPRPVGHALGEVNHYFYEPKGIAAVIAPWNFPLAISCGMASAAIVAGNCVVYKPSRSTPVVGRTLDEVFCEAGLPPGVFNFTPGHGSVIGDLLVRHPAVSLIAFTGSMDVGLRIIEAAGCTGPNQTNVKRVIAEMGGKNAVIVDDDADLDEAVPGIIQSAFGFQGQKCSACSRAIVLDAVYERFLERLIEAARSLKIGPAEDPSNFMGPVIDAAARSRILGYIELAKTEGAIAYMSDVPEKGYYVPLTIVAGIEPQHRLAQEEIFGPVLAVMRAKDFDQAIAWANSTRMALTGGVFSRSPEHLKCASREFRVGNLYLNRGCTGAMVERQPFGGSRMSGVGSKAGGQDYLLQFMDPRVVTENLMRRGFAPPPGQGRHGAPSGPPCP
jgi:RHH-type proline utilization regulon transcriptional repressor/proline dehydrogenase/delta 1-pyrroline-5-carboxylate dehydrogenase